jgi:transposase-like protein
VPRVIVTDKLASYQVAHRELMASVRHRRSKYLNNRAEGTVIPEGAGCVKRLLSSGFAGFRAPCRQHWVRAGVKTERPQRSEDERS